MIYQSSDGQWMDCDCPGLKSQGFRGVVYSFYRYRIACDVPNAELWRITPKRGLGLPSTWCEGFSDHRWQVPLSRGVKFPDDVRRWPVVGRHDNHCFFRDLSEIEVQLLREGAEGYLAQGL